MCDKLTTIINIANQANDTESIEIWTPAFKVRGTLLKDQDKIVNGIITLKDAKVSKYSENCGCSENTVYEWMNVFEDQIISFTVFK